MEFTIKSGSPEKQRSACVVVGVFDNRKLSLSAELIDRASNGYISEIIRRGDMEGKLGATLLLHNVRGTLADRVLLVGLGKERDFRDKEFRQGIRNAVKLLNETGSYEAVIYLTEEKVKRREVAWRVEHAVVVAMDAVYRFEQMKSEPAEVRRPLRKLTLSVPQRSDLAAGEAAAARGLAIANGMDFAKDLGNLPGNVCTPRYLAERAQELARQFPDVKVTVLERPQIEALGMGSFLSVTNGSDEPPRFIVLEYEQSQRKQKPLVLVGKGITFDTGGISIKPAADMDQMKFDMCGAASVLGAFRTIAELKPKLNLVGLIPACENMPSGRATKPGDIVKTMSGQTVEVLNTDAEGRLILADALTYAERYEPEAVVDIATLTGAMVVSLGHVASGLFSNSDTLARALLAAGDDAYDRGWQLPLWEDYQEGLTSNFADFANVAGRAGGSITAACFLSRFAKKYDWAHLDIAGTAWKEGKEKGATGRPVPMLATWILAHEAAA
ncbi:MAG: leucyl aminopeptidase [Betaproteobacteria bacterium]|nr:leucyl aminopeptidase [Betaproteobacteria bacterium]MDE2209278.1 leucyl aminopeptidase [Betaproteobacteria bacterium]MDE2360995.1 leucyl aminopeptidase [Betaproteobacteria bacterium]